jgi:adenine phosphoribosyltransferase
MTDWSRGIRDVPDFPTAGIVFKDITPLWADPKLFRAAIEAMAGPFRGIGIRKVVGIEARGFIFGPGIAMELAAGFVPARKPGKLPRRRHRVEYLLEYGEDALEIHDDALAKGESCLIVDDLLATGGTARAASELVRRAGGEVAGFTFFLELAFLKGRDALADERVESVVAV